MHDSFIQHATNVTVTRHAACAGPANLRNAPDRLRIMVRDHLADFPFGNVQTMANSPMRVGLHTGMFEYLRLTEVHGEPLGVSGAALEAGN